tara:strand:- start:144 stop:428 length:285 start_codon:yes stop_codon:yes gene_type:complete
MEQEGLTILSSVKLFDHWYCPVHAVVAKAKVIESTATNVKELEDENELLRAKVQDLLEELDRKNRDASDWTNHQTESNSSQRQKSAFKISSIGY